MMTSVSQGLRYLPVHGENWKW